MNEIDDEDDYLLAKALSGGGIVIFGLGIELVLGMGGRIVAARFLNPSGYGYVSFGMTLLTSASLLSLIGLHTGVARYIPRHDDPIERIRTMLSGVGLSLGLSIIFTVLIFFNAAKIDSTFLEGTTPNVVKIFASTIPFFVLVRLSVGIIQGYEKSLPKVVINSISQPTIKFLSIVIGVYLGLSKTGLSFGYSLSFIISSIIGLYFIFIFVGNEMSLATPNSYYDYFKATNAKNLLFFSFPLFLTGFSSLIYDNLDMLLLGYFIGSESIGIYDVVYATSRLMLITLTGFSFLALPMFSRLLEKNQYHIVDDLYNSISKWIMILLTPIVVVFILYPSTLLAFFYGSAYTKGTTAFVIFAIAFFIRGVSGPNKQLLIAQGRTKLILYTNIGAAGVNIVLNLLLIPSLGVFGAALATAASFTLLTVFYNIYIYINDFANPIKFLYTGSTALLTIFIYLVVSIGVKFLITDYERFVIVAFLNTVGAIIYYTSIYLSGYLDDEIRLIRRTVKQHQNK
jgi:O-antigen/teichoic acid export membrane protein